MAESTHNPYTALQRVFHEPNRLAIMSSLGGAVNGLTFRDLKDQCDLTDGNLSRHLKTLEEAEAVRIEKKFVGARPRTTVYLTHEGRVGFVEYLSALEEVFQRAAESMEPDASAVSLLRDPPDTLQA